MSSILLEIVSELIKIVGIALSGLCIRWMMELSTPARDWRSVTLAGEWLYDSIRIPDWREWFNMERLSRLREHPDVVTVVDGSLVVSPVAETTPVGSTDANN